MAVDAEPGFDQHYETADTFGDLHREMVGRRFWMSDLELTQAGRTSGRARLLWPQLAATKATRATTRTRHVRAPALPKLDARRRRAR